MLLTLAEAAWQHQPVEVRYTARDGKRSERTLRPYGIVVHSGRWYVTGADSASGEVAHVPAGSDRDRDGPAGVVRDTRRL